MKTAKLSFYLLTLISTIISIFFLSDVIQVPLHFHLQQTAWLSGSLFLSNFLNYAGGPADYLALYLSQFFGSGILGGIIISFMSAMVVVHVFKTLKLRFVVPEYLYYLLPIIQVVVIAMYTDYLFPFSILFNLFVVAMFLHLSQLSWNKYNLKFSFHVLVFAAIIYYISGGMYFLIFMISSILLSIKKPLKYSLINSLSLILFSLIIPWLAFKFVFDSSLYASYFRSTPDVAIMLRYSKPPMFYVGIGLIPFFMLLFKIFSVITFQNGISIDQPEKLKTGWYKKNKVKLDFAFSVILIIGVSVLMFTKFYKPQEKLKVEIDLNAYQKDWDKVLELSEKVTDYDRMVNFQFNRAISQKGQMLENLFNYRQLLGSQALFLDRPFAAEITLPNSDLYYDLGNIDESLRLAFESQTLMPESPRVIRRLIMDCIIQGKTNAAFTYLNVLESNPVEKHWAEKYRKLALETGKSSDSEIELKRRVMVKSEGIRVIPRIKVWSLLEQNPQNKQAFEYLIAFDLMEHDLNAFIEDLRFFPALQYPRIPKVLEEAIVLFQSQRPYVTELFQYRISPETIKRFKDFASLTSANRGNREKAKQATIAYHDTYWYYVLFESPMVTNIRLETQAVDANY